MIETFILSMDNVCRHMNHLREEARTSMDHLRGLHEATHHHDKELKATREDIVAQPWTWLGGNKRKLREMDLILDFLKDMEKRTREALAHVTTTLWTLQALDVDMEELRTRVASPDVIGDKIPIEAQIRGIKAGLGRLKEGEKKERETKEGETKEGKVSEGEVDEGKTKEGEAEEEAEGGETEEEEGVWEKVRWIHLIICTESGECWY